MVTIGLTSTGAHPGARSIAPPHFPQAILNGDAGCDSSHFTQTNWLSIAGTIFAVVAGWQ